MQKWPFESFYKVLLILKSTPLLKNLGNSISVILTTDKLFILIPAITQKIKLLIPESYIKIAHRSFIQRTFRLRK